jgi:CubicO group peptidase (beta-lactamase class C family)
MKSGLSFTEKYELVSDTVKLVFAEPNTALYASSFSQAYPSGTFFSYTTGNTALLSYMLR